MERIRHFFVAGVALVLTALAAGCGSKDAAVPAGQPSPILASPPPMATSTSTGKKMLPPPPGMRLGPPPGWHK